MHSEQDALLGPAGQISSGGSICTNIIFISLNILINEGGNELRRSQKSINHELVRDRGKGLTDDNYFHLIEWAKIESVEYELSRSVSDNDCILPVQNPLVYENNLSNSGSKRAFQLSSI